MREGTDVQVCEVGLRDGLQGLHTFFPTAAKQQWIAIEGAAGMPAIEVCSFVPTSVSIQFTDALETVAHALAQPGLHVMALIPNLKGAERALPTGVHQLNFVTSVSEEHNLRNVRRTVDESLAEFGRVVELRNSRPAWKQTKICGAMATALGCTIRGQVEPKDVLAMGERYLKLGADELAIADTVGYASPRQVKSMFQEAARAFPGVPLTAHFHDTRGLGLANVVAALEAGCRRFDASLAGLGGCPFAPGATGNIVMDDLVFLLESMGLKTGVNLPKLLEAREIIRANLRDEPLYGAIAKAGLPKGFKPATGLAMAAE